MSDVMIEQSNPHPGSQQEAPVIQDPAALSMAAPTMPSQARDVQDNEALVQRLTTRAALQDLIMRIALLENRERDRLVEPDLETLRYSLSQKEPWNDDQLKHAQAAMQSLRHGLEEMAKEKIAQGLSGEASLSSLSPQERYVARTQHRRKELSHARMQACRNMRKNWGVV